MGRALALAAIATGALALAPDPGLARFSVSPTVIHVDRQKGEAASGTFDVKLRGEKGREFEVEVQDLIQQPDGSTTFAAPTDSPFSASSWVSVTPRRFAGEPNRTQPVQFTVRVPAKATPGDHVTSLTVKRLPDDSSAVAETIQAISVRLNVNVFGKAQPAAEITSFDVPGNLRRQPG